MRQITFDIEHYMEETIRGRAKWGDRYIAFTNYDLQILDVSDLGAGKFLKLSLVLYYYLYQMVSS